MRIRSFGLVALGIVTFAFAGMGEQIPLWPGGKMPIGASKEVGEETISPKGVVKNITVPAIEVFLPTNVNRSTMGVIICPGGAYGGVDFQKEGVRTAKFLNSIGVAAFVLKYRVRPYPKSAALADLQRAFSVIRSNSKKWRVPKQHLGVLGYSAGGHLATRSAAVSGKRIYEPIDEIDSESVSPSFVALVYPAYLVNEKTGAVKDDVAPALTNSAPFFVLTGLADLYRFNAVGFAAAHVAKNRWPRMESHFYPHGAHGFGVSTKPHNDVYRWERLLATWLRRMGRSMKAPVDASSDKPNYDPIEVEDDE